MAAPTRISGGYTDYALTLPANDGTILHTGRRLGFDQVIVKASRDANLSFGPAFKSIFFYNASAAAGARYEGLLNGQNTLINAHVVGGTGTSLDSMVGTGGTEDFIYFGLEAQPRGITVDVGDVNGTAGTAVVKYSKSDGTFANITVTDGTDTGATMAQDGTLTWTVPSDWQEGRIEDFGVTVATDIPRRKLFWLRYETDNGFDSNTEILNFLAMSEVIPTATGFLLEAGVEYTFDLDASVGSFESISEDGSAGTLDITWIKTRRGWSN
jgi:hypothetical protein